MTSASYDKIQDLILAELEGFPPSELRESAGRLSGSYRDRENIRQILSPIERAAYLGVRFPATFAVAESVWDNLISQIDPLAVRSILDVGAGPGTASLASAGLFPAASYTYAERDHGWREIAGHLARAAAIDATFLAQSVEQLDAAAAFDIIVACYSLNELPKAALGAMIGRLWRNCRTALVIVEPGTPLGFETVLAARRAVLSDGGHVASPCTHDNQCPMTGSDWCHTPVRVERSAAHRFLKRGALGFEDEKFSHVVLTRGSPRLLAKGRVIRRPIKAKGHVHLDLCSAGGIQRVTVSRRHGSLFKQARAVDWGDAWTDES